MQQIASSLFWKKRCMQGNWLRGIDNKTVRSSFIVLIQRDNGTSSKSCHGTGQESLTKSRTDTGRGNHYFSAKGDVPKIYGFVHQYWRIPCNANTLPCQRHKHVIPTLVLWSIVYLGIAVREITFLPFKIFMQNMVLCPSRVGFLTGKLGLNYRIDYNI